MSEPFIGQIQMYGFNFAPRGWALCDGQLLPISTNTSLFSLLGTTYGGDGRTTFALPDLRGRVPIHQGTGPGLSPRKIGSKSGSETVTLTVAEMPGHNHQLTCSDVPATLDSPVNNVIANVPKPAFDPTGTQTMSPGAITNNGGSRSHNNMQPYLTINFCIALVGIFPSRS